MSVTKVTGMMQTSTKGGDISSASPTVIDTDGDYFDVTGTTNFAAFTVTAGRRFTVQFDGALTMTHHATNLDLPGGANITTAAGDVAEFFATGANTVQCVNYTKADGTAVVAGASGDLRNFIIDGDFTQFPEGNITAIANSAYGAALWENFDVGGELVHDVDQLSDAPTVGESSHSSTYSMSIDITTAESAVAAGDFQVIEYKVTGSDFAHLNQQEVTLSFWHKHTKTGTFCGYFMNSAEDRSYVYEYTQSSTNTWEKHTETVTLDTSGTWLLTEADIGLRVGFCMYGGSTFQGTADSWEGAKDYCTSSQVAGADSASNFCKFSQVGLYLGSSAPTFLGESISVVVDQVDYYVEKWDSQQSGHPSAAYTQILGLSRTTTQHDFWWIFRKPKRAIPTVTVSAAAQFDIQIQTTDTNLSGISTNDETIYGFRIRATTGAIAAGVGMSLLEDGSDTASILIDARH
jgi:hypothetical protein